MPGFFIEFIKETLGALILHCMKNLAYLLIGIVALTGCEKTIHFKPNDASSLLVVDASIESGRPPLVILSRSLDYFSEITPELLEGSFVHSADVYISTGNLTHKLKEYAL